MPDNEFETKGNKIQTKDKIEPQHVQRDQFASETQHAAKTVHAVSKTLLLLLWYVLTLTAFSVLVSGKFPCFLDLEIDILFSLNYKSGTKLVKIYSTGNAMFIPTYNKRTNTLVKNLRHCSNMSRRECNLTCLVSG